MKFHTDEQRTQVLARLSLISLIAIMIFDAVILMAAYFISLQAGKDPSNNYGMVSRIFFLVALIDLPIILLVKRARLSKMGKLAGYQESDYSRLWALTLIIMALCCEISILGLLGVILGNTLEYAILMIAISLVAFQLFRLRPRDFEAD